MFFEDLSGVTVPDSATMRGAIESINESGVGASLIVNRAGILLGIISDGDIRRAILAGLSLDTPITTVMTESSTTVPDSMSTAQIEQVARSSGHRHLPLTDENGLLVGLYADRPKKMGYPRDNTVVIMAGGLGMRLRPLTEHVPKPLLSVGGKPIVQHTIELLRADGFSKFVISINYLGNQIEKEFGDGSRLGVKISYLREPEPLGTCGSLALMDVVPNSPVVVVNGDILLSERVGELVEFHEKSDCSMTVGVKLLETRVPYGVVNLNEDVVLGLDEKPIFQNFVNAGIYVLEPSLIHEIPQNEKLDMTELLEQTIGTHGVRAFLLNNSWMDLGRPEDLIEARRKLGGL